MMNLAVHGFCRILFVMNRWPSRRAFSLMLGVLLALGMSLSAAQAGGMVVKMVSMASDMGAPGHDGCDGCGSDDGKVATGACLSVCTIPALAEIGRASWREREGQYGEISVGGGSLKKN